VQNERHVNCCTTLHRISSGKWMKAENMTSRRATTLSQIHATFLTVHASDKGGAFCCRSSCSESFRSRFQRETETGFVPVTLNGLDKMKSGKTHEKRASVSVFCLESGLECLSETCTNKKVLADHPVHLFWSLALL